MADGLVDAVVDIPPVSVVAAVGAPPHPHSEMDALLLGRTRVSFLYSYLCSISRIL